MTTPIAPEALTRGSRRQHRRLGFGPKMAATLVWMLLGVTLAYWGYRWWEHGSAVAVTVPQQPAHQEDTAAVARALGAGSGEGADASSLSTAAASRFSLVGVATDAQGQGVALLAQDGQAPLAVRVGASLPDGWVLRSLTRREAVLAPAQGGPGVVRLSVPEPNSVAAPAALPEPAD